MFACSLFVLSYGFIFQGRLLLQVFLCHHRQSGKPAAVFLSTCCCPIFVSIYKNIIMWNYTQSNFFVNKNNKGFKVLFDFRVSSGYTFVGQIKLAAGNMKIKVIIADDHTIVREGLKSLLEKKGIDVIDIAKNGREAISLAKAHQPDVVLMDISMPDLNGVEATAAIRRAVPNTKVIALSMHSSKKMIDKMIASGASGYVLKESAFDELYDAIKEVNKDNFYLTPSIARMYGGSKGKMVKDIDDMPKFKEISKKEREVLQLVAEGEKTKNIAEKLCVSIKTIETHRASIMKKLGISTIAGLTKFAIKEGIISLE